jgi:uncharacterized protein YabN with tetrapyrrole methylase and pyrophosphatase domain
LRGTLQRFSERVRAVEQAAKAQGTSASEMPAAELDALWERNKRGD